MKNGLIGFLHFRCSAKYPIPGYRIQSLCVAESEKPCCNTKNGTCGNTAEHCKCSECTDFRDFKSAELLQWVTKNADCGIRNITTNEACNFFNKFKINLTFIGKVQILFLVRRKNYEKPP